MLGCLFMTPAFAQDGTSVDGTFEFIDAQGNVVADGTELTCHDMNESNQISTGLKVKNTTNATAGVQVAFNILSIDGGSLSVCFPKQCKNFSDMGKDVAPKGTMTASETKDFQTEWVPVKDSYGKADVTFQLVHKGLTKSKWEARALQTRPSVTARRSLSTSFTMLLQRVSRTLRQQITRRSLPVTILRASVSATATRA